MLTEEIRTHVKTANFHYRFYKGWGGSETGKG